MISKIHSFGLNGIRGYVVTAECFLSSGLPGFEIVGLPDSAVKEARERVRAAIKACGFRFPVSRITVNLAPADTRKAGTTYDLPMLLGILSAGEQIRPLPEASAFFGELSLSGEVRPIAGALPMAVAAARAGYRDLFVPEANAREAAFADGVHVYPVRDVRQLLLHLSGAEPLEPAQTAPLTEYRAEVPDFCEVKGQESVKRALEIAAAGGHNVLMVGPPGAGKSMLAKRLPGILPDMTREEMTESTEIHSVAGITDPDHPVVSIRPFRAPHHTVTSVAMTGGTAQGRPGEISLAHNGVLFLDELPEFSRETLETLRQPLEDDRVTISRAAYTVTYPSRFMLVCAMNPCRCGWYGHPSGRCTCTESSVNAYHSRLSGPLLDRIDIICEVQALDFEELSGKAEGEPSAVIRQRVNEARARQLARSGGSCNARLSPSQTEQYCALDEECRTLMRGAYDAMGLTARSYDRILRVARTIADLDGSEIIRPAHLAEAIQYRTYDLRRGR